MKVLQWVKAWRGAQDDDMHGKSKIVDLLFNCGVFGP